ncbi:angio-associated migratory cell protein-like isoform X2 [Artemia franciscana]|uniref:angio-associated migratory cell protein-like isoform X2 n=1 Tax=Artemia franciscana TaxID=6661 RepID=UPI0032DA5D04
MISISIKTLNKITMGEQKRGPSPAGSNNENVDFEDLEEGVINEEDIVEVINLDDDGIEMSEDEEESEEEIRHFEVEKDDSVYTFSGHKGPVFCCRINPVDKTQVITGGKDDLAYIWKVGEPSGAVKLDGFKDSVTEAAFSHDGMYAAVGDLSGVIKVFKVGDQGLVWSFEIDDLNWLKWHFGAHVLFAGDISGSMWMWQIPSGMCKTFSGDGKSNNCGVLFHSGDRFACGYADGTVKIWNLKTSTPVYTMSETTGRDDEVAMMKLCIDINKSDQMLMTGGADGNVTFYNPKTGVDICKVSCGRDASDSIEAVSFSPPSYHLAAIGTLMGNLTIWDISTMSERSSLSFPDGIVRLAWSPLVNSAILHTVSLDGVVATIDARSNTVIKKQLGHTSNILNMDLSVDGSTLVSSSDDSTAKVYTL